MACSGASFNLKDCIELKDGTSIGQGYPAFGQLFDNILPNIYVASGIIIFGMILLGGFTIISNASDTHKIQEGQKTITSAIIGLAVIMASYWIIQLIQVITGVKILNSGL